VINEAAVGAHFPMATRLRVLAEPRRHRANAPAAPKSQTRLKAAEPFVVTIWGTPLEASYRSLYREIEVLSASRRLLIRHRHHGFLGMDDDSARIVAEFVEIAGTCGRRHSMLRWFVSHGRDGILPPRILAAETGIDPETLERSYFDGICATAVETDLHEACRLGARGSLAVSVGAVELMNVSQPDDIVEVIRAMSEPDAR
jgi:hypothetical protein